MLALAGLGVGFLMIVVTAALGAPLPGASPSGVQVLATLVSGLYAASPALIVGTVALAGVGIMSAVERNRLTAVELGEIKRF